MRSFISYILWFIRSDSQWDWSCKLFSWFSAETGRRSSGHPNCFSVKVWILFSLFLFQVVKFRCYNFFVGCIIDIFISFVNSFIILINDIFTGVSDLIYHTDLGGWLRKYGMNGVRKSIQIVGRLISMSCTPVSLNQSGHTSRRKHVVPANILLLFNSTLALLLTTSHNLYIDNLKDFPLQSSLSYMLSPS